MKKNFRHKLIDENEKYLPIYICPTPSSCQTYSKVLDEDIDKLISMLMEHKKKIKKNDRTTP